MPRRAAGRASSALFAFSFVALRAAGGDPGGIVAVRLKPSPGTRLMVTGRGTHLLALGSPLSLPVTAQLVTSGGRSRWQGTGASGDATRSSSQLFHARRG
jgi:hypothetical protein